MAVERTLRINLPTSCGSRAFVGVSDGEGAERDGWWEKGTCSAGRQAGSQSGSGSRSDDMERHVGKERTDEAWHGEVRQMWRDPAERTRL